MNESVQSIAVNAAYTPQSIARMQGNPLIEALPPEMSDDQLLDALTYVPDFEPEQRQWDNRHRIQQIKGLSNFMLPLGRHLELARMIDVTIREGYVGRAPRTKESVAKLQEMYELQKQGKTFVQAAHTTGSQDSAALLGPSGMGKTTTVRRHLANYPRVIYHKNTHITQVSYIHIDLSSNGHSVKSLAIAVIAQLDALLPECKYHSLYLTKAGRTSTEALIITMGRLLATHCVGLLVADEVQNLCNSPKGAQTVMTELVTMCNTLNVPILFIGTNKAAKVLGADFRQARRSTGMGIAPWTTLPRYDENQDSIDYSFKDAAEESEWSSFIATLWQYQWVRKPIEINREILDFFYERTQGVIDLAIKLFAIAQVRAILNGDEALSIELFDLVYERDFKLLHEAIEAMASNDLRTLAHYEDVAPLVLDETVSSLVSKATRKKTVARLARPGDTEFKPRLEVAARAVGFEPAQAHALANEIEAEGVAADTVDGLKQIYAKAKPAAKKTLKRSTASPKKAADTPLDFADRPDDYRRALKLTQEQGTTVLKQQEALGMAPDMEQLISLD